MLDLRFMNNISVGHGFIQQKCAKSNTIAFDDLRTVKKCHTHIHTKAERTMAQRFTEKGIKEKSDELNVGVKYTAKPQQTVHRDTRSRASTNTHKRVTDYCRFNRYYCLFLVNLQFSPFFFHSPHNGLCSSTRHTIRISHRRHSIPFEMERYFPTSQLNAVFKLQNLEKVLCFPKIEKCFDLFFKYISFVRRFLGRFCAI